MMRPSRPYRCWAVRADDYPDAASIESQARFLLRFAILAPSTFNSQPWKCRLQGNRVEVYLDRARMPVRSDKAGRFAHISIGCFVRNLLIAAEHYGWRTRLALAPTDGGGFDGVASVELVARDGPGGRGELLRAARERATNRSPSAERAIPSEVVADIQGLTREGAALDLLDGKRADALVALSLAADREIWADPAFRKEQSGWVRHNLTRAYDGMPGFGVGIGLTRSFSGKRLMLSPAFAELQARKNAAALRSSPLYAVLSSREDPANWIRVGMAYEMISLRLALAGIAAPPMGQFIESDGARRDLGELVATEGSALPQMFFRLGYPTRPVRHSPRLPVERILL